MDFDLDRRTASLSVGEFSEFKIGPRESSGVPQGLWRARIGTDWHQRLHAMTRLSHPTMQPEVPIEGRVAHRGWLITLSGRIDQVFPASGSTPRILREIKTITSPLPADEAMLQTLYPDYFVQLAAYLALARIENPEVVVTGQLLFVEIGSGATQIVTVSRNDESLFAIRLESLIAFLDQHWRTRERLKHLRFRPAFHTLRPGQESARADLESALATQPVVAFEAPTGFGKTGVLLECALRSLQRGKFNRVVYLTGKSTGQLQVVKTLKDMTSPDIKPAPGTADDGNTTLAIWQVRAKSEHCINTTFHCVSESCSYLAGAADRWERSGLSRFYLLENHPRDLDTLKSAGRETYICPYEITRAALAFNEVWVGDFNYVFAPRNRSLFFEQPGFEPARTLLIVDEAHNLPARAADAHSHSVRADEARATLADLESAEAGTELRRAWTAWADLLTSLPVCDEIDPSTEDDLRDIVRRLAEQVANGWVDHSSLGLASSERLWEILELHEWLTEASFPKLLWSPLPGELRFTCIDASSLTGAILRTFGTVLLSSATFGPMDAFSTAIGVNETPLLKGSAADPSASAAASLGHVVAHTPWREGAYRIAYDLRVDTTYRKRATYSKVTAATVESLRAAAGSAVVVFFPSYRYAETIAELLSSSARAMRVALQPRGQDLAAQAAWIEESLLLADALFLVLGSGFAESVDLLGGRVTHAMVVGPALPEVNAVQRARMHILQSEGQDTAFRRVYQIPGMQKVNQALGRLVRAPGQQAHVLLHCRRFGESDYASLLATDYQFGTNILSDEDLTGWLEAESK
ncbi:MAG: DEAD/DEAH box helicase family protein [Opitutaceae bacterium]|nr:DEAD/DEAH box helicase family protein [Opitutaceae bacterium]